MSESELIPRSEKAPQDMRLSPIDRKFADLPPGKYWKLTDAAKVLGVSPSWLRRRLNNPTIKAPSMVLPQGDAPPAYVYTQADIEELRILRDDRLKERK
jgi:AraC-like DNA-binding protein